LSNMKWMIEYRCPKCGRISVVTNICRECDTWMIPTGFEEETDGINTGRRRGIPKDSPNYERALSASYRYKDLVDLGEVSEPLPEWAWFGEERGEFDNLECFHCHKREAEYIMVGKYGVHPFCLNCLTRFYGFLCKPDRRFFKISLSGKDARSLILELNRILHAHNDRSSKLFIKILNAKRGV